METRSGSCQCDGVKFEFTGEPSDTSFCHCSLCRKLSGSAFAPYIGVTTTDFRVTDGRELVRSYDITDRLSKTFCSKCGTPLWTEHSSYPGFTYVLIGVLGDDRGIVPEYHQFAGSKAEWYSIADGLPQHDEWPT